MKKIFINFLIITILFQSIRAEKIVQNVVAGSSLAVASYLSYKKAQEEFQKASREIIPEAKQEAAKATGKLKRTFRQFKNELEDKSALEKDKKNIDIERKYYFGKISSYYKRYKSPLNWTVFASSLAVLSVCRFIKVIT